MSTQLQTYNRVKLGPWLEEKLLAIADECDIRIVWDTDSAIYTGVLTVVGGLVGALVAGRIGATIGAGLAGVSGYASSAVALRVVWPKVKEQLLGLLDILFNFLKKLNAYDYINAFAILMSKNENKKQLALEICAYIATVLGRESVSKFPAIKN